MRKPLLYARLAVSVGLVAFFAYRVDFARVLAPIAPSGWPYIALMAVVTNLDRLLMSYKWDLLLRAKRIELPFSEILRSYYIGTFWGTFLPSSIGGDVVRAYGVSGRSARARDIVSSVVLERVLGTVANLLTASLCAILILVFFAGGDWKLAILGLFLPFAVFLGLVRLSFSGALPRWLDRRRGGAEGGSVERLASVLESYRSYQHHRGAMLRFFVWSLVEQCFPTLCVFVVARALPCDVSFLYFLLFVPVIMAFSKIPISLDGFGVREGLYVYFFSYAQVAGAEAFRMGFVSHVLSILALLPGYFYFSATSRSSTVAPGSLSA